MLLILSSAALAVPEFPGALQTELGMDCVPACTVCHSSNLGGTGTVVQPFGEAMLERGLIAGDLQSLADALDAMGTDAVDSDGDGVIDTDELTAGGNPNDDTLYCGEDVEPPPDPPIYGCLSVTGASGAAGGAIVAMAALVAGRRRRV